MTFRKVDVDGQHKRETHASVVWSEQRGFGVGLSAPLLASLRLQGDAKYSLHLGEGENAGLMRLLPDPAGRVMRQTKKGGAVIQFGKLAEFEGIDPQDRQWCAVKAVDGGIEIKLPAWAHEAGALEVFQFTLDKDAAGSVRSMAAEADQPVPDYIADVMRTYVEEYQREKAEAA